MTWRLAKSLEQLRKQVNEKWPKRDKGSDGTIGDEKHSARASDHNPNEAGIVCALDITNDPAGGPVARGLAEAIRSSRDPRIKYIISNAQICSSYPTKGEVAWAWRPYTGSNAHRQHVHFSVFDKADLVDSVKPWIIERAPAAPVKAPNAPQPSNEVGRGKVTAKVLNVRSVASISGKVITRLKAGTEVLIFGKAHNGETLWYEVGPNRWVAARFIKLNNGARL